MVDSGREEFSVTVKFGLFGGAQDKPQEEFEGEYLVCHAEGDCVAVSIIRNEGRGTERAFAVIRLPEGWYIKEIE